MAETAVQAKAPEVLPPCFRDILRTHPKVAMNVMFDVGANVGQSAIVYAAHFPEATIWAAEPTDHSFTELTKASADLPRVKPVQIAFGPEAGTARMTMKPTWTRNHITNKPLSDLVKDVQVDRLDQFCARQGIDHINFLKIDTEGYDLEVLKGATGILPEVDFVQAETSMNRYNRFHVSYQEVFDFMSDNGFMVYNIYGLSFENRDIAVLRRADPVFINSRLVPSLAGRIVSR